MNRVWNPVASDYLRRIGPWFIATALIGVSLPLIVAFEQMVLYAHGVLPRPTPLPEQLATLTFINAIFFGAISCRPLLEMRHLFFTRPVSNAAIGKFHLVFCCVTLIVGHSSTMLPYEWITRFGTGHATACLFLVGAGCLIVLAGWRLARVMDLEKGLGDARAANYLEIILLLIQQGSILVPPLSLLGLWLAFWVGAGTVQFQPVRDVSLFVLLIAYCWPSLVHEISQQRQGDSARLANTIDRWIPRWRQPACTASWTNQHDAFHKMLWSGTFSYALALAICMGLLLGIPAGLVLVWEPEGLPAFLGMSLAIAPITAWVLASALAYQIDPGGKSALRPFLATHPLNDAEFGKLVFRHAIKLYTSYWMLLLIVPLVVLSLSVIAEAWRGSNFEYLSLDPTLQTFVRYPYVLLAIMAASWGLGWSIMGIVLGLEKRVTAFLLGGFGAAMLALASLEGALSYRMPWAHHFLNTTACATPAIVTIARFVQAITRGLIDRELAFWSLGMAVWFSLTAMVFALAVDKPMAWLVLLIWLSMSTLCILPRAAIPVMLQKRRTQ